MPAYLELHAKGGGRAYVDAGMIGAVITANGCGVMDPGTASKPVRVVLRMGEAIDVIGDSAAKILVRALDARKEAKLRKDSGGEEFYICQLNALEGSTDGA